MPKLEAEPRLNGLPSFLIEWARKVVQAVNPLVDSDATQAQQIATLQQGWTTGDFKFSQRKSTPAGWIVGDGSTIGNVGSGATRANIDTLDLFTLWWTDYTDAQLPILTSAGGASTRGASAAADWAAGKRLTVFDMRDRMPRAAGTVQANGTKLEATQVSNQTSDGTGTIGVTPLLAQAVSNSDGVGSFSANYSTWAITVGGTTSLASAKVRVASLGMLPLYKL